MTHDERDENNMSDPHKPNKPLSEISHLFLSSIRERQTNGQPPPQRKPPQPTPQRPDVSIDMTPQEFAQMYGDTAAAGDAPPSLHIAAVIGAHLNGKLFDRVKQYAAHLATQHQRVGLIELDACDFRLMLFEHTPHHVTGTEAQPIETLDAHRMTEALAELSWDVQHWIVLLPNPRLTEARNLLRAINRWVLFSTCDHDGVIACYKTLKGLSDLHHFDEQQTSLPRLSLALFGSDQSQARRVFGKLSSVCQQFLNWPIDHEPVMVQDASQVAEHLVLCCRATRDKAQLAAAPQWQVVGSFITRADSVHPDEPPVEQPASTEHVGHDTAPTQHVADVVVPTTGVTEAHVVPTPSTNASADDHGVREFSGRKNGDETVSDVIDLPSPSASACEILAAVLHTRGQWIQCPIPVPHCSETILAVGRDRRLALLAVARQGLSDLRDIGRGYQWLVQNRALVAMALPQLSIDAHAMPRLQLMIDQSDMTADLLQPLLQSSNVTVQAYRKLRWGQRTGLLLEAA